MAVNARNIVSSLHQFWLNDMGNLKTRLTTHSQDYFFGKTIEGQVK